MPPVHGGVPTGRNGWTRRRFLLMSAGFWVAGRAGAAVVKQPLNPPDLSFLESALDVIPRADWAPESPRPWLLREAGSYDRLTIHHAGLRINRNEHVTLVQRDIEGIWAGHIARGYGDLAYHFVVDYAGRVWEGRPLSYEGAHVSGENKANIGVMLLGNFEKQAPSPRQLSGCTTLVQGLRRQYGIKQHRVYGHRDIGASDCPGRYLYPHVQDRLLH